VTVAARLTCAGLAFFFCIEAAKASPGQVTASPTPSTTSPELQKQQLQELGGLENSWDVRAILDGMSKADQQLAAEVAALKPQQWFDQKGAPTTYILQSQLAQQQARDVAASRNLLMQHTDDLAQALDLYFRLEALDVTARSLAEGAKKYADRQTADRLTAQIAQNFAQRERFRDYIKDLAVSTQQNFKIADAEAQRCRGMISMEPPKKVRK
jgi:hypothetical protein